MEIKEKEFIEMYALSAQMLIDMFSDFLESMMISYCKNFDRYFDRWDFLGIFTTNDQIQCLLWRLQLLRQLL